MSSGKNIGWIGTGVMGAAMAGHLQRAGHQLFIINRTKTKAEPLLQAGAVWCETPVAVAAQAEIVFTMVGYPKDVEEVYLGPTGLIRGSDKGSCRILVDMTTSSPDLAQRLAQIAQHHKFNFLDAPVSGGDIGARNATLAIMVGGEQEIFDEVLPLFRLMGQNIALMGGPGTGQHTKMCNQILIAGTMIGVCEALLYADRLGLNARQVIEIVGKGAAASWSLGNLAPRMLDRNFAPGFYVEHFIKDLGLALQEADAAGLDLPGLKLAHRLYNQVQELGHGRSGTQALLLALEAMNR